MAYYSVGIVHAPLPLSSASEEGRKLCHRRLLVQQHKLIHCVRRGRRKWTKRVKRETPFVSTKYFSTLLLFFPCIASRFCCCNSEFSLLFSPLCTYKASSLSSERAESAHAWKEGRRRHCNKERERKRRRKRLSSPPSSLSVKSVVQRTEGDKGVGG